MPNDERILETMPTGTLGLVATDSCIGLAQKVDAYLQGWREHREHQHANESAFKDYYKNSYIIKPSTPRFGSGEAKCVINQSVRGYDLYIMVDVTNYSIPYSVCGYTNHMSPDDHFQDLKRVIAAAAGKARRINVIMPFLYESRQHKRSGRESLDCAMALQELVNMGVENIITFDFAMPKGYENTPFNTKQMQDINQWLQTDAENILFIYGGLDPWSATAVDLKKNTKCLKYVKGDMDHKCRIASFEILTREAIVKHLKAWLTGTEVEEEIEELVY